MQLVPPVLLVALIGLEINAVYFAIVLTTMGSLAIGITAATLLARSKRYRLDPARNGVERRSPPSPLHQP